MTYLTPSRIRSLAACLFAAAFLFAAASHAEAADTVYWANFFSNSIAHANLAGGGGGVLDTTGALVENPNGLTIDAAAGKAYWINGETKIYYANLSGGGGGELNITGATQGEFSVGMAIDPSLGRIYWANSKAEKISYANLNGSGGGDLNTSGATVSYPLGVAVDPSNGKIYWANDGASQGISYANLTGGGGGDLDITGATVEEPDAPAIDSATGKIYWADEKANKISYANLSGGGGGELNTSGATVQVPFGVAIDPAAGRIYWANEGPPGVISYANLNGTGGADLNTSGATLEGSAFPVLLKAPSPGAPPQVSGGPKPGSTLTCTPASWAADLLESFLYQVPQSTSMQWLQNGQAVAGATATTLKAGSVGSYSCQGTATNQAGSASQTSAPVAIFKLGKVTLNKKKGTATLAVQVPGAGTLTLTGKQLVKQKGKRTAASAGTVKLLVKAKGKAKKALAKKGKAKVSAKVGFAPASGSSGSQTKSIVLKQKLKG
jgi:DNA-binding beta-propeller fold protein YncE